VKGAVAVTQRENFQEAARLTIRRPGILMNRVKPLKVSVPVRTYKGRIILPLGTVKIAGGVVPLPAGVGVVARGVETNLAEVVGAEERGADPVGPLACTVTQKVSPVFSREKDIGDWPEAIFTGDGLPL
jgi:hypothetical protein